ncbi:putative enoyl-CoA hydratase [Caenibius tardaugens NBRC 16725]|uniref:Putative enoyl-CoA hydratase n=1 Tax=Caenibius tardaugens NBRC 16725 TaxID=1219035 RepID=U2YI67_9SPHN|nr:crotonase/enoyl-CoA hydratase family protein [Caenibius tardaugens]AZI38005.1 enoyl-CoA hydratase [Caenibius tardaugens NBRC 16725]GAD47980.1 putative enoyl-CoA hydratase [Caenibius tardaugens NBRC 16725]
MDRLDSGLERSDPGLAEAEESLFFSDINKEGGLAQSLRHLSVPQDLYTLNELDVFYEDGLHTLWTYMRPQGRPSFTPTMLRDFVDWQNLIANSFGPGKLPLKFLVLGSRAQGVFCFGGDLKLFQSLIREGNREGLVKYGYRCVEILERNARSLDLPLLTIGLVEGSALGGGFESLLSFDVLVAERGATFGLPEVIFGLFPGMGAHAYLTRKVGSAMAERMILSNESYTAEQLYDMGIVHVLAEKGEGLSACREYIQRSTRRHAGLVKAREAMRLASPVSLDELKRIVDIWADAALGLTEQDLKVMNRLARAQSRLAQAA